MSEEGKLLVNKLKMAVEAKTKENKAAAAAVKRKKFFTTCSITKSINS